jgi:hypothetical protein
MLLVRKKGSLESRNLSTAIGDWHAIAIVSSWLSEMLMFLDNSLDSTDFAPTFSSNLGFDVAQRT